jgi:hypothetical protein
VHLVDLQGAEQDRFVRDLDGGEGDDGPHQLGHPGPRDLVERLQHIDDLGHDQVGQQELAGL